MKTILMIFTLSASLFAQAEFHTQDNSNYLVAFAEGTDWNACAEMVCKMAEGYGTGGCTVWEEIGGALVNVTTSRAEQISQLSCVIEVRPERLFKPNPRFGRGN